MNTAALLQHRFPIGIATDTDWANDSNPGDDYITIRHLGTALLASRLIQNHKDGIENIVNEYGWLARGLENMGNLILSRTSVGFKDGPWPGRELSKWL